MVIASTLWSVNMAFALIYTEAMRLPCIVNKFENMFGNFRLFPSQTKWQYKNNLSRTNFCTSYASKLPRIRILQEGTITNNSLVISTAKTQRWLQFCHRLAKYKKHQKCLFMLDVKPLAPFTTTKMSVDYWKVHAHKKNLFFQLFFINTKPVLH